MMALLKWNEQPFGLIKGNCSVNAILIAGSKSDMNHLAARLSPLVSKASLKSEKAAELLIPILSRRKKTATGTYTSDVT